MKTQKEASEVLQQIFGGRAPEISEYGSDYILSRICDPSPLRDFVQTQQARRYQLQPTKILEVIEGERDATENN